MYFVCRWQFRCRILCGWSRPWWYTMKSTVDMQRGKSKSKQRQMLFQMHIHPIFGEIISSQHVKPDPWKLKAFMVKTTSKIKKEPQTFLGIINYLSKFSPSTADVYESLRQLTSSKAECTWHATYQKLFDEKKSIIAEDVCMKFYDETPLLYLETDTSGIRLGTALLQSGRVQAAQKIKH